jgi:UDP-N-acetylmuramyl pentapeptide phosphotransferase/UDP-N-acetylglucosamine-1-phosphate transferase
VTAGLSAPNHRGVLLPRVLGYVLLTGGAASAIAVSGLDHVARGGVAASLGALLVTAAGAVDDAMPSGPRGLRGHVRALAGGHVTTGVVKVVVVVGAAIVIVAAEPDRDAIARVAGVVLVAGASNVWNGLDVRPGRALKFGYLVLLPTWGVVPWPLAPFVPGVALAAVLVLPWDAGERAMLGDAGANLLGFTIGIALYLVLDDAWVAVAAVVAVVLNVLADTVTLSRLIELAPPLRWYDGLGTRRA